MSLTVEPSSVKLTNYHHSFMYQHFSGASGCLNHMTNTFV